MEKESRKGSNSRGLSNGRVRKPERGEREKTTGETGTRKEERTEKSRGAEKERR